MTYNILLFICSIASLYPQETRAEQKKAASQPKSSDYTIGTQYTHNWEALPSLGGLDLETGEIISIAQKKDHAVVVVFLASWCLPCQALIPELKKMEEAFNNRFTQFVYLFASDTLSDARGFSKHHKLGSNTFLAPQKTIDLYHQPELPSIFVGDRHHWLTFRMTKPSASDLDSLRAFLDLHTSY